MKLFVMFIMVAAVVIFAPLGFVWSLNTLFHLDLDYTFETWAAALIFTGAVSGQGLSVSKKKE